MYKRLYRGFINYKYCVSLDMTFFKGNKMNYVHVFEREGSEMMKIC